MFKTLSSLFKKKNIPVIPLTPELIAKRQTLRSKLQHIYSEQVSLLEGVSKDEHISKVNVIKSYLLLQDRYVNQLKDLADEKNFVLTETNSPVPEEVFLTFLNDQLNHKVSELEFINNSITSQDLKELDSAYNLKIDKFFNNFHFTRINSSFLLKEYIDPSRLLASNSTSNIINDAIKTTSHILSLNGYPVPIFDVDISSKANVYCVQPHIVHILFELFKNSTLPSIASSKPINIKVSDDKSDSKFVVFQIKDNGGGMPEHTLNKIWHFHYTTSKVDERDPIHGFGMGLPLCKVFADFNKGHLSLVNKEGDGVSVFLRLPKDQ